MSPVQSFEIILILLAIAVGLAVLPRRIVTVLSGESLVNDASGLVLYRFAVAAIMTGLFDPVMAPAASSSASPPAASSSASWPASPWSG